ncbi:2-oxoacid:acceptor oxidoreductase subunit alpha [Thalassobacillus sp. CUG 92003]|uniref:2-oxoacid:acceptor oxidoreductase subunit alpha n=1 Tax=Thalassobacillus sp. CUG 92003 TaxID=2736641 RepID=UPI0015E65A9A|nr:2-oxoacid:acceptor oxidoreductase subunit alpha [Thalassobacillus sp. CUG 92003]
MNGQISWKVGGQQGEGIESTGEIFALTLNRQGYYLYGYRHFSSRIKGGHTHNKIRIATKPVRAISEELDILVAFDQETIDLNAHELHKDGIVLADAKFKPSLPSQSNARLLSVPFSQIAKDLGSPVMKNMVAIGASSALVGMNPAVFNDVVAEIFERKGKQVIQRNVLAIEEGAAFVIMELSQHAPFILPPSDRKQRLFMIGNDALSLGFLAGGCRFMAAYPITPASEIMEYMINELPDYGGAVIQTEDEMAAATMAIGANYAGVRAVTASAGPGLSLMMESIGLSGMTETPLVIVDTQRGGPSTGLPTKQEQSDLFAMIYGTHGEIPKIVMAPSTVQEAFHDAIEALNLAEEYQVPVIILSDLQLSLGKQTIDELDYKHINIRRGKILHEAPEVTAGDKSYFDRYRVTGDGISERILPGLKDGIYHVTGVEHDATGKPSEKAGNRKEQMDKRLRKLNNLPQTFHEPIHAVTPFPDPDIVLIGFNSTRGPIQEAMDMLKASGVKVNCAQIRLLEPFPAQEMQRLLQHARVVLTVEHNATGQLANLIKMNVGCHDKIKSLLQYDGTPFYPKQVYQFAKELL